MYQLRRQITTTLTALALTVSLCGCPSAVQQRPSWLQLGPEASLRSLAEADPRAQRDLGLHLLLVTGDGSAALEQLEAAARRDAADPLTHLALAVYHHEVGVNPQALASLSAGLEAAVTARGRPDWCHSPGVDEQPDPEDCRRLARIVEEAMARLLRELDTFGRQRVASELLEQLEGQLHFASAHQIRRALEHDARVDGDGEAAQDHLERSGALLQWRVAGPFGPFPNQSFDIAHPPEQDRRLADTYDLGPGRDEQPTWEPHMSSGSVQLRSAIGRSGTWYAETTVQAATSGPVDLRLWTSNNTAVQVQIGDLEVISRDERRRFEPSISVARFHLEAAVPVRVRVKLSSAQNDPGFSLALRDAQGDPLALGEAGGGIGRAREVDQVELLELVRPASGEEIGQLRAFVTALFARARGFWPVAEEALWRVEAPSPLLEVMRATASGATPTAPRTIQDDRMLSGMRSAFERDPSLWRARLVIARQLTSEDQGREALDLLREGLELHPENASLWHELGVLTRRIGLQTLAQEAFENALSHDERSCGSLYQLAMMAHDVGQVPERERALERLGQCNATTRALAQVFNDTGRADRALAEVQRLRQVDEFPAGLETDLADLHVANHQYDQAREVFDRLLERWPLADSYVGALADLDGAAGDLDGARDRLTDAIERAPWEMGGLRRVASLLGAPDEVAPWRVDGLEMIERFEQENLVYDAPSVFVLDRAVYRIYEDMSSLELVHQVTKVLTQEAVGPLSEFDTPRGGEVLTLRTIKPDGTILEPLSYDPEETTNLASVEVGDYVEWEYVIRRGPSRTYPGGLQTPRFYFATSDTAMHLSEMLVLVPEGVEVDFVPRGPSPPSPEPIRLGEMSGVRFAAERVRSQSREPSMPSHNEVFPSIAAVARENARSAVAAWSDGLELAMRPDWRMRQVVRDLRQPAQTEQELARTLYDWVLDHVQHGRSGTPATFTLATGHGDALLLYTSLLRIAGFSPEIIYAWGLAADRSGPYLMPGELGTSVVRVELDDEERWIHLGSRHAPMGHLPASVRGQPGLVAGLDADEVRLPEEPPIQDLVATRVQGTVGADGTVEAEVSERFQGTRAAEFRGEVSRIPESERAQRGAAMLGQQFPGAIAEAVRFSGVDDRHDPVEITATISSRMLGRQEPGALLLPARLSQGVRYSSLTNLSERQTTLVFDNELHEVIEQTIRLPEGAQVERLCPEAEGAVGEARFSVSCQVAEGQLTHRLEMFIPPQRISPEQYREFSDFLRTYDEAAATETRLTF